MSTKPTLLAIGLLPLLAPHAAAQIDKEMLERVVAEVLPAIEKETGVDLKGLVQGQGQV